jgi:hypothetical protein
MLGISPIGYPGARIGCNLAEKRLGDEEMARLTGKV